MQQLFRVFSRYFVIVYPLKTRMPFSLCYALIAATWLVACFISIPYATYQMVSTLDTADGDEVNVCHDDWEPQSQRVFSLAAFVLQYVAPCFVITYCYTMVSAAFLNSTFSP